MEAIGPLLFPALLLAGFYLLAVKPQRARLRAVQAFQATLAPGQRVITTAGIHGTVTSVGDDVAEVEVSPGVQVTFARAAVVRAVDDTDLANPDETLSTDGAL